MAQSKTDFGSFSNEELVSEIRQMEADYQRTQFDHTVAGLMNPMTIRFMRRDIARGYTEVRRREIEMMTPEELANRSKKRSRRRGK